MSLAADERLEQWERGYQAALREAVEQLKAHIPAGHPVRDDVIAVIEAMRHD